MALTPQEAAKLAQQLQEIEIIEQLEALFKINWKCDKPFISNTTHLQVYNHFKILSKLHQYLCSLAVL